MTIRIVKTKIVRKEGAMKRAKMDHRVDQPNAYAREVEALRRNVRRIGQHVARRMVTNEEKMIAIWMNAISATNEHRSLIKMIRRRRNQEMPLLKKMERAKVKKLIEKETEKLIEIVEIETKIGDATETTEAEVATVPEKTVAIGRHTRNATNTVLAEKEKFRVNEVKHFYF